jgi:transketolase
LTGLTGKTHQDIQDLAIMRAMPGMTVLAPADEFECEAMIRWATDYQGPVYLRLSRDAGPVVFDSVYRFNAGRVCPLREGRDLLIVSTGTQTPRCLQAAEILAEKGLAAGVLHIPTIKPINIEQIVQICKSVPVVFTVEEHTVLGGLGGLISEILSQHLPKRVIRIGIDDRWGESAPNDYLLEQFGLSPARVSETISNYFYTGRYEETL